LKHISPVDFQGAFVIIAYSVSGAPHASLFSKEYAMQPVSGPGVPVGDRSSVNPQTDTSRPGSVAGEQPLSPAQRTTLERLIVRIMSLSTLKAPELWAGP